MLFSCEYHIVLDPKHVFRILTGSVTKELRKTIHGYSGRMGCEIEELNVQSDHVHLLVSIPPKELLSIL